MSSTGKKRKAMSICDKKQLLAAYDALPEEKVRIGFFCLLFCALAKIGRRNKQLLEQARNCVAFSKVTDQQ